MKRLVLLAVLSLGSFTLALTSDRQESRASTDAPIVNALDDRARSRVHEDLDFGAHVPYGEAVPGTGSISPTFDVVGRLVPGNTVEFRVEGGVGGGKMTLVVSRALALEPDSLFAGVTTLVDSSDPYFLSFEFTLNGTPGAAGEGSRTIEFKAPPSMEHVDEYSQVFITDPGAAAGVSATNALHVRWGK